MTSLPLPSPSNSQIIADDKHSLHSSSSTAINNLDHIPTNEPAKTPSSPPKDLRFWLVFLSICCSMFLSALDLTSISTALPASTSLIYSFILERGLTLLSLSQSLLNSRRKSILGLVQLTLSLLPLSFPSVSAILSLLFTYARD